MEPSDPGLVSTWVYMTIDQLEFTWPTGNLLSTKQYCPHSLNTFISWTTLILFSAILIYLILTKTTPTHPHPTWGITFQGLNQVWSWSNLQDCFIIINQDDISCQRWPLPSSLWSGTLNIIQVPQRPFSKPNQINLLFLTKLVKSTKLSPL